MINGLFSSAMLIYRYQRIVFLSREVHPMTFPLGGTTSYFSRMNIEPTSGREGSIWAEDPVSLRLDMGLAVSYVIWFLECFRGLQCMSLSCKTRLSTGFNDLLPHSLGCMIRAFPINSWQSTPTPPGGFGHGRGHFSRWAIFYLEESTVWVCNKRWSLVAKQFNGVLAAEPVDLDRLNRWFFLVDQELIWTSAPFCPSWRRMTRRPKVTGKLSWLDGKRPILAWTLGNIHHFNTIFSSILHWTIEIIASEVSCYKNKNTTNSSTKPLADSGFPKLQTSSSKTDALAPDARRWLWDGSRVAKQKWCS